MICRCHVKSICRAIAFIEKRLPDRVNAAEAIKQAGMSEANFRRIFLAAFGTSIASYIRGRRLTMIARQLTGTTERIADICMRYGCDSPEIITRSFKKVFGTTPEAYRRAGRNLIFLEQNRLSERTIKHVMSGGITREPVTEITRRAYLSGLKSTTVFESINRNIKSMFMQFIRSGAHKGHDYIYYRLSAAKGSLFLTDDRQELDVTVGTAQRSGASAVLPAGKYAVFRHNAPPRDVPSSYEYIFRYWMKQKMAGKWPALVFQKVDNKLSNMFHLVSYIYIPLE